MSDKSENKEKKDKKDKKDKVEKKEEKSVKTLKSGKNDKSSQVVKKLLPRLKNQRFFLILSLLMAVITVLTTLYVPVIIGHAIDLIIGQGQVDFDGVFAYLTKIGIIIAITALTQWIMNICNNHITYHVTRNIRNEAIEKIESLPLSYIDKQSYGDIVSRVIADVNQLSDGLLMGFTQFFTGVMTIVGTLCFMLRINSLITLVVVLLTPLSFLVAKFIARKTFSMFRLQSSTRGDETALVEEMIDGASVVHAYSYEERAIERFDEVNEKLGKYSLNATFYSSITNPATRFINSLVYAAVAVVGAIAAIQGRLTVGQLASFLSYANQYTKPFNEISGVVTELQNALACASRVFDLLDEENELAEAEDAIDLAEPDGTLKLSQVEFSYVSGQHLIENFNLDVKKGQKIAIVGPTGCGKTTLINLLMRFYDVKDGSISVSGIDVRNLTRRSLRAGYGMVLQDTWLKAGTIRDNITMGKPDASDEEVIAAAKAAHAHGFITRLKNGYDTVIAEDDDTLSAGQRQLLCITRIMLVKPKMLILDEATSSIDTRTELKIQEAFNTLMEGRTSFIVAHRLSTIENVDIILVMKDGSVIETGNHQDLLEKKGFYYNLYNSQFAV